VEEALAAGLKGPELQAPVLKLCGELAAAAHAG
jgi:hypothetical protein